MDVGLGVGAHHRQLFLRKGIGEVALMLPYIITGIVALIVTFYLFAALLFPERF